MVSSVTHLRYSYDSRDGTLEIIWVNHTSLSWLNSSAMAGDDFPKINHDSRARTGFGRDQIYPDLWINKGFSWIFQLAVSHVWVPVRFEETQDLPWNEHLPKCHSFPVPFRGESEFAAPPGAQNTWATRSHPRSLGVGVATNQLEQENATNNTSPRPTPSHP